MTREPDDELIQAPAEWVQLAWVGGPWAGWGVQAEAFRFAGDRLVEDYFQRLGLGSQLEDLTRPDERKRGGFWLGDSLIGYPVFFLYRHSIELSLKEVLSVAYLRTPRPLGVPRTHSLSDLWSAVRPLIRTIWPSTPAKRLRQITKLIDEFDALDPTGETYRYPIDSAKQPTIPSEVSMHLPSIRDKAAEIAEMLDEVVAGIHAAADLLSEMAMDMDPGDYGDGY